MRNWIKVTLVSVVATTMIAALWSVVHGETELFDEKRSARDIEVMCGILNTSVNYAVRELGEPLDAGSWRSSSIRRLLPVQAGRRLLRARTRAEAEGRGGSLFAVGSVGAYSTAVTEYNLARTLRRARPGTTRPPMMQRP